MMYSLTMRYSFEKYFLGAHEYLESFRSYGTAGILEELRLRHSFWSLASSSSLSYNDKNQSTSITDRPDYLKICHMAATDKEILENFKRCHEYRLVLEHVSRFQGQQYLEFIKDDLGVIRNLLDVSPKEIGNPVVYNYPNIGRVSPTQIRYAKILKDIESFFGNENHDVIIEVGIGNGGQAWQISNYLNPKDYYLVDLPEVLSLTLQTGAPYNFETLFHYVSPEDVSAVKSDLFISNYAFSELKKVTQDLYFESFIRHANRGYMLYNHIHAKKDDSYTVEEMQAKIPNSRIMVENPKTYRGNYLLIWGSSQNH